MKRLTIVLLAVAVAVALASPLFGQGKPQPQPKPPAPPAFVEAQAPDGKALVYFYPSRFFYDLAENKGVLVLSKNGPIGIVNFRNYLSYVADTGTIKFWIVGYQGVASVFRLEATAGQVYYIKADTVADLELIPAEKARKEIAVFWPLPE